MFDLNDLAYFVKVVDHGGFAPAARALGMQKSKLSRRIAGLEQRLGVRLIQRSTRKFVITDIGHTYYQHCLAMLVEAETAQQAIDSVQAEPAGLIRVTCPPGLLTYRMGMAIAEFMAAFPRVEIELKAYNRPVDLIGEGFDLVIRTGEVKVDSASLVMRKLGEVSQCLVASPELLKTAGLPENPVDLSRYPGIAVGQPVLEANGALMHGHCSTKLARPWTFPSHHVWSAMTCPPSARRLLQASA